MSDRERIRAIAVDWSGAKSGEHRKIWVAEVSDGRLARLENGRTREEVIDHLCQEADWSRAMVVGLDFAFSFPEWFCKELGADDGPALWRRVGELGDEWLEECPDPFWGRRRKKRPELPAHFRKTEEEAEADGLQPKSVFQVGGGGAVGPGSIRGMPYLVRLHEAGFNIWPFHVPRRPLVLEIYPRAMTGPVVKSDKAARERYLGDGFPEMTARQRRTAAGSDDAFDAAISAITMARHMWEIVSLSPNKDRTMRIEGAIWRPSEASEAVATRIERPEEVKFVSTMKCPLCAPAPDTVIERSAHGLAVPDQDPVTLGHTLVVPQSHVGSVFDLPTDEQADLWALVTSVRNLLTREHGADGFTVGVDDGPAAGQSVQHAHIHVIPRYQGDVLDGRRGVRVVIPERW
jgi:diadenosine tetraphosphate (Ap4A) HIT family hydrolase